MVSICTVYGCCVVPSMLYCVWCLFVLCMAAVLYCVCVVLCLCCTVSVLYCIWLLCCTVFVLYCVWCLYCVWLLCCTFYVVLCMVSVCTVCGCCVVLCLCCTFYDSPSVCIHEPLRFPSAQSYFIQLQLNTVCSAIVGIFVS